MHCTLDTDLVSKLAFLLKEYIKIWRSFTSLSGVLYHENTVLPRVLFVCLLVSLSAHPQCTKRNEDKIYFEPPLLITFLYHLLYSMVVLRILFQYLQNLLDGSNFLPEQQSRIGRLEMYLVSHLFFKSLLTRTCLIIIGI